MPSASLSGNPGYRSERRSCCWSSGWRTRRSSNCCCWSWVEELEELEAGWRRALLRLTYLLLCAECPERLLLELLELELLLLEWLLRLTAWRFLRDPLPLFPDPLWLDELELWLWLEE